MKRLTHITKTGDITMVDVSGKPDQIRIAMAAGTITLSPRTIELLQESAIQKGDVLTAAKIAGIQAAKRTPDVIPLCHTLNIDHIDIALTLTDDGVDAIASIRCTGRTGAEMEVLYAVSTALLTVYDMCKAVDQQMEITGIHLIHKEKKDV